MSKTITLILEGKESFSSSKLEQIQLGFNKNNNLNSKISCNDIYLISVNDDEDYLNNIKEILDADDLKSTFNLIIGPRVGTISPWSSKTKDILKNVGIENVENIEKFYGFNIDGTNKLDTLNLTNLYDRMTQGLYFSTEQCKEFLSPEQKRPLRYIDILDKGIEELHSANKNFGFAMSTDEIDYLFNFYTSAHRNPTDAELMMFAQANSEHCRHKIFNAKWTVDGEVKNKTLFDLIKDTSKNSQNGIISAYKDNAAITAGKKVERLNLDSANNYSFVEDILNTTIKVETHNHPTAISPFPGAATGSGGEIRDEGATGRGAKPKIGLVGFNVSNLRLPELQRSWEGDECKPERIASPLDIMIEGPIGAAAFNNEFGRPSTLGYFRSFETAFDAKGNAYGYHKPIMLAGGIGEIRDKNNFKLQIAEDYIVVVLGGPAMLIGLGGGAASSVSSGESDEDLDFASVQRENPEMERRCQEVINICSSMDESFIEFIHDVGAGGLSNAIPELAKDSDLGVYIELDKIPVSDPAMSPMEIWSNESQERYVLAIHPKNKNAFEKICIRERCEYAFVGKTTTEKSVKLFDKANNNYPVDVPLDMLFGDLPITDINIKSTKDQADKDSISSSYDFKKSAYKVLSHPTVASKSFLITIGDRTVGGMVARDQFVGPYQVPVSNYSMSLRSFTSNSGEVVTIGEKPTLAIQNSSASMRMAIAEALTNMIGVPIKGLDYIQVSANWMAPTNEEKENYALRSGVEALSKICIDLDISIPVGKDSLSMKTKWIDEDKEKTVTSPLSGVVTSVAPVNDVTKAITPELSIDIKSDLILVKLNHLNRLGGSIFGEVNKTIFNETPDVDDSNALKNLFNQIQTLIKQEDILALHDISDGGLLASIAEMCFTQKVGMNIKLPSLKLEDANAYFFSEEIGLVIQVAKDKTKEIKEVLGESFVVQNLGTLNNSKTINIACAEGSIFSESIIELESKWREVSHSIQSIRDNKACADEEQELLFDSDHKGLYADTTFKEVSVNYSAAKPKVAVLREQGVNGQIEMAAAFTLAGFDAVDVHMQDLLDGNVNLSAFNGLAACGGFSYGDVLGAGGGWSKTILNNNLVKDQFEEFFNDQQTFTLGVCNGCQMVSNLKDIIPGASAWPSFVKNISDQFEARLAQVRVAQSDSVLLKGMEGWSLPIASAHGEGHAAFTQENLDSIQSANQIALNFVDSSGKSTENYPLNPNGSVGGITGVTAADGRVTIMMPHPERVFRSQQMSWRSKDWKEFSPWMQIFYNALYFSKNS